MGYSIVKEKALQGQVMKEQRIMDSELPVTMAVMLVGYWPDLGTKCGARADFLLMQPTWYAKGTVRSDL